MPDPWAGTPNMWLCRDLGGRGPEAALAGRESRWSGKGGMCAAGRVALLASPSRGAGPAPAHPLGRSDVEKCPWRPGSLSEPVCGPGVGGGGGPGPSPPPLPRRGGPPGAPRLVPAGGGDRAGRGRGKRQLRFQRVGPRASSRCRRTGKVRSLEARSGREESIGQHALGQRGSRDSGQDLETRLDPATESPFPLTLSVATLWPVGLPGT